MRYQYTSSGFKNNYSTPFNITNGIKKIILINIIIFILTEVLGQRSSFFMMFGLVPHSITNEFKLWQIFTYMFMHGGVLHILFNMVILWVFGKDLEIEWGENNFFVFYLICGMGAGLVTYLFNIHSFNPVVGASGAIYGLLAAYGLSYPNRIIYFYFYFPLKVKYAILGLGFISLFASFSSIASNISHITHLSGMLIGVLYMIIMQNKNILHLCFLKLKMRSMQKKIIIKKNNTENIKNEVNQILDKINDEGWESLSSQEEKFLTNYSKKNYNKKIPN